MWGRRGGCLGPAHRNNNGVDGEECGCGREIIQEAIANILYLPAIWAWSAFSVLGQAEQKLSIIGLKVPQIP